MADDFSGFFDAFETTVTKRPSAPVRIPEPLCIGQDKPEKYVADRPLLAAAKAAVLLGKPLLLTGEPGTGKTQFASHLNWRLGFRQDAFVFETKSNSTGRDLFYTYNSLAYFYAAQIKDQTAKARDFISFNALGEAILHTREYGEVRDALPTGYYEKWVAPHRSVVLVDEIDKAPRDFPNDILNEVERMRFSVPELRNEVFQADRAIPPVLVLTSNSEKNLPDAFLRRCVYYHIPFPEKPADQKEADPLERIVLARIDSFQEMSNRLVREAIALFRKFRAATDLEKKPATGELLDWLLALVRLLEREAAVKGEALPDAGLPDAGLKAVPNLVETLGILFKTSADLARGTLIAQDWLR